MTEECKDKESKEGKAHMRKKERERGTDKEVRVKGREKEDKRNRKVEGERVEDRRTVD